MTKRKLIIKYEKLIKSTGQYLDSLRNENSNDREELVFRMAIHGAYIDFVKDLKQRQ